MEEGQLDPPCSFSLHLFLADRSFPKPQEMVAAWLLSLSGFPKDLEVYAGILSWVRQDSHLATLHPGTSIQNHRLD